MTETQHIEFKATWRDEYLKWVCGFANAEGGVLCIGRDDAGNVVGLADAERLLEEIPKVNDGCRPSSYGPLKARRVQSEPKPTLP